MVTCAITHKLRASVNQSSTLSLDGNITSQDVQIVQLALNVAPTDCQAIVLSSVEYLAFVNALQNPSSGGGSGGTVQTPTPQNWLELGNMSIQDAQVISGFIGLLWAGVWGFKQVAKAFSISERNQDE
jgi:hypothetical protein